MQLHRKPKAVNQFEADSIEDDMYSAQAPPWKLSRQARETLLFCLVAGLIAALVWGIYRWTNASRYAPPLYNGTTTLKP